MTHSTRVEAGLSSSYKSLNVGGVIQHDSDGLFVYPTLALFMCVVGLQFVHRLTEWCLK